MCSLTLITLREGRGPDLRLFPSRITTACCYVLCQTGINIPSGVVFMGLTVAPCFALRACMATHPVPPARLLMYSSSVYLHFAFCPGCVVVYLHRIEAFPAFVCALQTTHERASSTCLVPSTGMLYISYAYNTYYV